VHIVASSGFIIMRLECCFGFADLRPLLATSSSAVQQSPAAEGDGYSGAVANGNILPPCTDRVRRPLIGVLEPHDHLAKHASAFEPRETASNIVQGDFGIDDGQEPACHLGEAITNVAHGRAERAKNFVLLLK
jgi:hypothetical protein